MKYRTVTLHAEENLGTSGTVVIPIRVKDIISALIFQVRLTVSTNARLTPEPACLSKIELVDGSDVLMSLSGEEMAALSFYEGNHQIAWPASNIVSTTDEGYLRVNFGRFLRDPLLALDPTRFDNLQLRVTYNAATVSVAATPVYLRVLAECFDEKMVSPAGFLQMRELHSYVGGATTYEYITLPTDLVLRKLYLQTKNYGGAHFQNLTSIRLSEDNDKRVPFDILVRDLMEMELAEFGRVFQNFYSTGSGTSYPTFTAICNIESGPAMNASRQEAIQWVLGTGGKYAFDTPITSSILFGVAAGSLPYFVHCYPFGDQKDLEDWYDVTKVGSLRFRVQSGSLGASCTYNTILQQLRRY